MLSAHVLRSFLSSVVVAIALTGVGFAQEDPNPFPVTLTVSSGSSPVIIYETDSSGLIKLVQTASNTFHVYNFAGKATLTVTQQSGLTNPIISISNPSGNPSIQMTWYYTAGGTYNQTITGGNSGSCSTCNRMDGAP